MPATKHRKKLLSVALPDGTKISPKYSSPYSAVVVVKSIRADGSYVWQPPEFSNRPEDAESRYRAAIRDLKKVMPSPLCKATEATVYLIGIDPAVEEKHEHIGPFR